MTTVLGAISKQFYNFNFPVEFFPREKLEESLNEKFSINLRIQSSTPIENVYSSIAFTSQELSEDKHVAIFKLADDSHFMTKSLQINF